jgi:hypothetical protein
MSFCLLFDNYIPKDENKEVDTIINLFHKYVGSPVLHVYVFLLILFHSFFVIPVVPWTTGSVQV